MDKIALEIKAPKNKKIEHNETEIEIIPFIPLSYLAVLLEKYIEDYFGTPEEIIIKGLKHHLLEAECRLKGYIFKFFTNIDMDNTGNDIYADSILWEKITKEIVNYPYFREILDKIVYDIKQEEILENSIGKVISDLIKKANDFVEKLSDFDAKELKEAGEKGLEFVERLEKSSVLNNPSDIQEIINPVEASVKKVTTTRKRGKAKKSE